MSDLSDVVDYIQGEMNTNLNSTHVASMRGKLNTSSWWNVLGPGGTAYQASQIVSAYKEWYHLVKTGGKWDHKSHIKSTYGTWAADSSEPIEYEFDIWSNIHYGYIGLACGFPEWDLLSGAGIAQVKAGTVPPGYLSRRVETIGDADFLAAFDDPKDQVAIRIGFQLWKTHGRSVASGDILSYVRKNKSKLSTRAMAGAP
jgi:Bacterial toxin 44